MSNTAPNTEKDHHVLIESIGTSNPSAAKILSDTMGVPMETIVKGLYTTPTLLFSNVEESFADLSIQLLEKLGLEARKLHQDDPIPEKGEEVDVAVYIHRVERLPEVTQELSQFLGCQPDEALTFLMNTPAVVLGGVSIDAAQALGNRLEEEITIVNPKEVLYDLVLTKEDPMLKHQLINYLKYLKINIQSETPFRVVDLSFEQGQQLWRKFQSTQGVKLINQGFQRFEIVLTAVDQHHPEYRNTLTQEFGIPDDLIDDVMDDLPMQLVASMSREEMEQKLPFYEGKGLICEGNLITDYQYKLIIEENSNLEQSREILKQYVSHEQLPKMDEKWEIPYPIGELLYRYIAAQLEWAGCEVDYEYYI